MFGGVFLLFVTKDLNLLIKKKVDSVLCRAEIKQRKITVIKKTQINKSSTDKEENNLKRAHFRETVSAGG